MTRKPVVAALAGIVLLLAIVAYPALRQKFADLQRERTLARGMELSAVHCAACHLEPSPDTLPKKSWEVALAYMGYMMGIDDIDYLAEHPDFARENVETKRIYLSKEGMIPAAPVLSKGDWEALRSYYVESAAAEPLPQTGKPAMRWELPQFEIVQSDYSADPAVTTLVHVRAETGEIYVGDSAANTIAVVGGDGRLTGEPRKFGRGMSPVDISFTADTVYVASIGDLFALGTSQDKPATISRMSLIGQRVDASSISVLIDGLFRMADMDVADLNADGVPDFVVCGFGARRGNLAWFESQEDGGYEEHVLIDRPGAVKAELFDFNGDGHLDIAALLSDAREGFYILLNDGANDFESTTVFEAPPSYGHTRFELGDFDGDGLTDIMTVNGDNVDSDPYNTLKNFHGIRIYRNLGDLRFEEAYFYPMYGAFGARAADFDNDGDTDIAAIAFFPDFADERRESFVFLQNDGSMGFGAYSSPALNEGRWMTLGAGDIDGDADIDIVLGGANIPTGMFAYMDTYRALAESAPSILILRNTLQP